MELTEQATHLRETTDKALMFGGTANVLTDACFNPARDMTRNKSFDISGIVEHGGLPFDPTDAAAGFAILDFKFQRAQFAFDALFFAIDNADAAVDEFGAPCLRFGKIADVTRRANQARSQFNKFNVTTLGRAIEDLEILVDLARRTGLPKIVIGATVYWVVRWLAG